jgi:malonyl-CoA/methylmalonyl-CoA synthetase
MCYEIVERAKNYKDQVAVYSEGEAWKYGSIINRAQHFATLLLGQKEDLAEARVAFMVNPGVDYVSVQWAIWIAGGIAVPLCLTYPPPSLDYVIQDTAADFIVASDEYLPLLEPLCQGERPVRLLSISGMMQSRMFPEKSLPVLNLSRKAMILYTSGTTNLPKGVVTTHANIKAQIEMLHKAWKWEAEDRTLCVLPLHHVHGIINVVCCSLWVGATCIFFPRFDPKEVVELLEIPTLTVFMAVPTIYYKLISYIEGLSDRRAGEIKGNLLKKRLMVSGSAALPVSVMEKWYNISGHWLLERYGMTEIGMAISNPYRRGKRKPGFVGLPLPTVDIRLVAEDGKETTDEPGEIQVKGPAVFQEYWRKKEATEESFTEDGWFKTGDTAVLLDGYYKILGRTSIDILKSGGYKISAIEIEEVIRQYEGVDDCSVVGIPNEEWGEIVGAAIILKNSIDMVAFQKWLAERLPKYKIPRSFRFLRELPRNAMGKVTKKDLIPLFENN